MSKNRANPSKGKHYNKEFKLSAVKMVLEEQLEATDVATRLGVPVDMLKRWVKTQVKRTTSKEQQSMKELIAQNKKHEEEIRRLKMEREILKKAMAYFMPEKS